MFKFKYQKRPVGTVGDSSALSAIVDSISQNVSAIVHGRSELGGYALAMESIDVVDENLLNSTAEDLGNAIHAIAHENKQTRVAMESLQVDGHDVCVPVSAAQEIAAVDAALISTNPLGAMRRSVRTGVPATENMVVFEQSPGFEGDFMFDRASFNGKAALEAYDERDNKTVTQYSVAYNLLAPRQSVFSEAYYPTIVVTNDQVGFTISIRLIEVYNEFKRSITGALDNVRLRNIIEAVIDPEILRNDQTKLVPVYRDEAKAAFVDTNLVAVTEVDLCGEAVNTAPLVFNKKVELLGLSQTDSLLETGLMDTTDAIDSAIRLENIYIKLVDSNGANPEVIQFQTGRLQTATANVAPQGNYRLLQVNFRSDFLPVSGATKLVDGSASKILAAYSQYTISLGLEVHGSINQQFGETNFMCSSISVTTVADADGNALPVDGAVFKAIAAIFDTATGLGYDLYGYRTNSNRRQRGKLLNTNYFTHLYAVPLRSPFTIPRPVNTGDANDSSDLAALITATNIQTSNDGIDELLYHAQVLEAYAQRPDKQNISYRPEFGIGNYLLTPFFERQTLDMEKQLASFTSSDRIADVAALLLNVIRDVAYRAYLKSGFQAANEAISGGAPTMPVVVVGCDPYVYGYLMMNGDTRTLGNGFGYKVVHTLNKKMRGKITIGFTVEGAAEGVPHPLGFGNMAWKPELTMVMPQTRNGAVSKELTVQPSYLHVSHSPIMAVIDVVGIEKVVSDRVSIKVDNTVVTP